jgi:hypothetical protein
MGGAILFSSGFPNCRPWYYRIIVYSVQYFQGNFNNGISIAKFAEASDSAAIGHIYIVNIESLWYDSGSKLFLMTHTV